MANIKDTDLNKGQLRKLNAYRKSVAGNEDAAQAMMKIYLDAQPKKAVSTEDKISVQLEEAMAVAFPDGLNLSAKGYTLRRSKGKGASGFVAKKNT